MLSMEVSGLSHEDDNVFNTNFAALHQCLGNELKIAGRASCLPPNAAQDSPLPVSTPFL